LTEQKRWVCTRCKEALRPGDQPQMLLLDETYGSGVCMSKQCHLQKRLFHLEVQK
jgi:hypothetical protein